MSEENTTKFRLDEKAQQVPGRLDSMSDEEILSDPDNPPLRMRKAFERVPDTKAIRKAFLTQREFAATFQLSLATVRDQGRYQPDQAARTLLR